ncbi:MAG: helix-turn-helix transcriptional regulator [Acidobacteria bacterium]|nr:helix-turn-helix transcriptional regulator [Acidobacteriota bacterium]
MIPVDLYPKVGQKVKEIRDIQGVSQEVLATRLGVTRASISNLERGKQRIYLHTLFELGSALETDISELLPERTDSRAERIAVRVQNAARLQNEELDTQSLNQIVKILSPRDHIR